MRRPAVQAKAKAAPKVRVKGDLAPPTYLLKLMEHVGPTEAAKEIGTSPGTLHKGRTAGVVSRVYEVAARGVWMARGYGDAQDAVQAAPTAHLSDAIARPTNEAMVLMTVMVPRGAGEFIQKAIERVGGEVMTHD